MIVRVDDRVGSKELHAPLAARLRGTSHMARLERIAYGDVAFMGLDPNKPRAVEIGVERKTLPDLIASMQSARLAGFQLPGMCACYGVVYLLVEGLWRPGPEGILEVHERGSWRAWGGRRWQRPMLYSQIAGFLESLRDVGVRVLRTSTRAESVELLTCLVARWQRTSHKSLEALFNGTDGADRAMESGELVPVARASWAREAAARLPGIGWTKSAAVVRAFPTLDDMVSASRKEWAAVEWRDRNGKRRKLGAAVAERVWRQLRSEERL